MARPAPHTRFGTRRRTSRSHSSERKVARRARPRLTQWTHPPEEARTYDFASQEFGCSPRALAKVRHAFERLQISRKTGYKIFDRYKDCGVQAFSDRSRRPHRQANRLPEAVEAMIVRLKREYPSGGAPKIREKLRHQVQRCSG